MKKISEINSRNASRFFEERISDMEALLGMHITVHDVSGMFRGDDGARLLPGRNVHRNPYCLEGRLGKSEYERRCVACCMRQADAQAMATADVFTKKCWKGVYELVVPVAHGNAVALVIFGGGFRCQVGDTSLLDRKLLLMQQKLPDIPAAVVQEKCCRMLQLLGQGLLVSLEVLRSKAGKGEPVQLVRIRRFIRDNAHRALHLEDLAKHLCLSPSRTSHLVSELFGQPLSGLLVNERMERAKALLIDSGMSVEQIAGSTGFSSLYYFSSAFKKHVGISPLAYRRQYLQH